MPSGRVGDAVVEAVNRPYNCLTFPYRNFSKYGCLFPALRHH